MSCDCLPLHTRALAVLRATATVPHLARPTADACDDTVGLALATASLALLTGVEMHDQPCPATDPAALVAAWTAACDEVASLLPRLHLTDCPTLVRNR